VYLPIKPMRVNIIIEIRTLEKSGVFEIIFITIDEPESVMGLYGLNGFGSSSFFEKNN
jgi:hypothetical protein